MRPLFRLTVVGAVVVAASGCAGSHRAGTPPAPTSASSAAPTTNFAVRRVQAAWPILRVFPTTPGTTSRCSLPGPGLDPRGIPARCRTTLRTRASGPQVVTFTESWPARFFRPMGMSRHRTLHHSWRFDVEGPHGRIVLVRQTGAGAPQSAE